MDNKAQQHGSNPQGAESAELPPTTGGEVENDPGSSYLITVQIGEQYESKLDADRLHRLAMAVLKAEGEPGPLELGVVVTTDEEVHALNREYLGHDYQTDVISFGMQEEADWDPAAPEGMPQFVPPPDRPPYLGDIAISYDRAAEQAPEYGHTPDAEVAMLLIHGLLHLLDYDDIDETSRVRMHSRQQELLETLYNSQL